MAPQGFANHGSCWIGVAEGFERFLNLCSGVAQIEGLGLLLGMLGGLALFLDLKGRGVDRIWHSASRIRCKLRLWFGTLQLDKAQPILWAIIATRQCSKPGLRSALQSDVPSQVLRPTIAPYHLGNLARTL